MAEIPQLYVNMLGGLELFLYEEQGLPLRPLPRPPTAKSQSLLAYLILRRGRIVPRERLAGMFWGERMESRARRSLSTALWHIRHCFPEMDPITGGIHEVRFEPKITLHLDVEDFETQFAAGSHDHWELAAKKYKGDLLEGLYDDWIINERYALHEKYLETLGRLVMFYETHSRPADALITTRLLLTENPLREDAHRSAMRAYCTLGQRNKALEQFRICENVIQKELGIDPLPETQLLYDDIVKGRFPIGRPTQAVLSPPTQKKVVTDPFDPAQPATLIGRKGELSQLHVAWNHVRKSKGSLAFVKGEAGVGKTFLIESFSHQVQTMGGQVLWGRSYEFERLLPFQPITEAIRPLAVGLIPGEGDFIPDWVLTLIGRLLPDTATAIIDPEEKELDPTRLFEGIAQFLAKFASHRPILLVLEDLHWATDSTLQLLHYLVRRLSGAPVLILGSYRMEEIRQPAQINALERQTEVLVIDLPRLSKESVAKWTIHLSGEAETVESFTRWLYRETEGSPFFVTELLRALFERGSLKIQNDRWVGDIEEIISNRTLIPKGIEEILLARVARLPETAKKGLRVAAVLGREFDFNIYSAALAVDSEAALETLDTLLRHHLIKEGEGKSGRDYAFTHHKIQEVVYAKMLVPRRQYLHQVIGLLMEAQPPSLEHISEIARHFDQASRLDPSLSTKAAEYYFQAGVAAGARFANVEASTYFELAYPLFTETQIEKRFETVSARERIVNRIGDRKTQGELLELMALLSQQLSFKEQGKCALRKSTYANAIGEYENAILEAKKAIQFAEKSGAEMLKMEGFRQWGEILWAWGDYAGAREQLDVAIKAAVALNAREAEAKTLKALGLVDVAVGSYESAKIQYERALTLFNELGARKAASQTLGNISIVLRSEGDYQGAKRYLERALNVLEEIGDRFQQGIVLMNLGVILWDQSRLKDARARIEESLLITREIDDRSGEAIALNNLGRLSAEMGDLQKAEAYLDHARGVYANIGERKGVSMVLQSLGNIAAEKGEYRKAVEKYGAALEIRREIGDRRGEGYCHRGLGDNLTILGDFQAAHDSFQQALAIFKEIKEQRGIGEAYRGRGKLFTWLGSFERAQQDFEKAQKVFSSQRDKMTLFIPLAEMFQRSGENLMAVEAAEKGRKMAEELGNRTFQAAALLIMGLGFEALGKIEEAASAYLGSVKIRKEFDQPYLSVEPIAGLARLASVRGEQEVAVGYVEELLELQPWTGLADPVRTALTSFTILNSVQDSRADRLLAEARDILRVRRNCIVDETLRQSFVEEIQSHARLQKMA